MGCCKTIQLFSDADEEDKNYPICKSPKGYSIIDYNRIN